MEIYRGFGDSLGRVQPQVAERINSLSHSLLERLPDETQLAPISVLRAHRLFGLHYLYDQAERVWGYSLENALQIPSLAGTYR